MSVLNIPCSNNYTQTQACQAAFTSTSVNGNPFASSRIRTLNRSHLGSPGSCLGKSMLGKSAHPRETPRETIKKQTFERPPLLIDHPMHVSILYLYI